VTGWPRRRADTWLFLGLGALAAALHAAGPRAFTALAFDRSSILRGEVWRLFTAHLVHVGRDHLLWNLAAILLVWLLVGRGLALRSWLVVCAAVAGASSAGVLLVDPATSVMAGLSGLLHGLWGAGATGEIRRGERLGWLLLAALAAKIVLELVVGPSALLGPVAVGVHALGALSGVIAGRVVSPAPPPARPAR
jgi:rhomboid family GlyGly-CTERM serine protease